MSAILSTKDKENHGTMSLRQICFRFLSIVLVVITIYEVYYQQINSSSEELRQQARNGQKSSKYKSLTSKNFSMGNLALPGIDAESPVLSLKSLKDLVNTSRIGPLEYWEEALVSRKPVVEILEKAGIKVDLELLYRLPKWSDVADLYGSEPVILGTEHCEAYRKRIPAELRTAAIAGQFNTGTNALAMYFGQNLRMRENHGTGFAANVPWHKHGWVDLRGKYDFKPPKNVDQVLPVVVVRDPYGWMQSMCESPYLLNGHWHGENCPNLQNSLRSSTVPATLSLGKRLQHKRSWDSLVNVWSEWYGEYYDADFPRLMIRFEDVLFHTPKVMDTIRECVGGSWANDGFIYQTASSKGGKKYFEDIKPQSSMISAIIKYGQDNSHRRTRNMTTADLKFTRKVLDQRLLNAFHYKHPDELRK
mmetsp:Transcript_19171/g.24668  ORF Transcript_19171/g.24668 Transcript_19171/m.24668 type:complete len:419 (-) Transcript_19171:301-1557(-)|eukprot:CAMPEP_0198138950 /NCGR_PEP_ID=MMETSP1443-20131203/2305_1 /TAXON_ID=186043 /ORGANISM="Entomoneis sp., Strain CCMP2396" /LENGTH=418 /DNA_ID=CAMNT_0043800907 /DNA_START=65 /DNA_END=1321 /DNA_ORIENTATION=+